MSGKPKSSLQLYRDCLRLITHVAGHTSPKAVQLRKIVGEQFRANRHVTDPGTLLALKQKAAVGLSNYLLFERSKQDPKIAAVAAELDNFEDDEEGNLVRVPKAGKAPKSGAGKKGGKGAVSGMPPPLA